MSNFWQCNNGAHPAFQPGYDSQRTQCYSDLAVGGSAGFVAGVGGGLTVCKGLGPAGATPACGYLATTAGGPIGAYFGVQKTFTNSANCQQAFCAPK